MKRSRVTQVCLCLVVVFGGMANADVNRLEKIVGAELALSHAIGLDVVAMNAIVEDGRGDEVAEAVEELGGRVLQRIEGVEFLAGLVPLEKVAQAMAIQGLVSVDFEPQVDARERYMAVRMYSTDSAVGGEMDAEPPTSEPKTMGVEAAPRFPFEVAERAMLRAINADKWREAHPTYDGRGVVIAHVEIGLADLLAPELQVAYDLGGHPIPKFRDVVIVPGFSYGLTESEYTPSWGVVQLESTEHSSTDGTSVAGRSYEKLGAGVFQLGTLTISNSILEDYSRQLIDVDAGSAGDEVDAGVGESWHRASRQTPSTSFAFAWHPSNETLWFDRDRDGSWEDESPIQPFGVSGDVIVLGEDDAGTPNRESIGLVFQFDKAAGRLLFALARSDHATMVAGSAAGNKTGHERGHVNGVAPGAQIVPFVPHRNTGSYAKALVSAFANPQTDIILVEADTPTTGPHDLLEGRSVLALLVQRLIDIYDKPLFSTAGNTHGTSKITDLCVTTDAVCVGAYQSRDTTLITQGVDMGVEHSLHWVGASGPATNGAIKPDFLAPSNIMTLGIANEMRLRPHGRYAPVHGYQVGGGTSNATPIAVGAAALIISGAKQRGLPHGAKAINRAFRSSAHFIGEGDIEAYQQGRGVIDVAAAWHALESQNGAPPLAMDVEASVRTVHSEGLAKPHLGVGLFEREGWFVGNQERRMLILTRRNGPDRPLNYALSLRGDTKTFAAPKEVRLPLDRPVEVEIEIDIDSTGAHSALLAMTEEGQGSTSAEIGLNILVAESLAKTTGYRFNDTFTLRVGGRRPVFAHVAERVDGLWVRGRSVPESPFESRIAQLSLLSPSNTRTFYYGSNPEIPSNHRVGAVTPMPDRGVWEIVATNRVDYFPILDASLFGKVAPEKVIELDLAIVSAAIHYDRAVGLVRIDNRGAALFGGLATSPAASFREESGIMAPHTYKVFGIDVAPGAELLVAEVAFEESGKFDADLYLYFCDGGNDCRPVRHGRTYTGNERVIVQHPAEGYWKVVVVSYGAHGSAASYQYRDYWTHPKFGTLVSGDALLPRDSGATWTAAVTPVPGRTDAAAGRAIADVLFVDAPQYVSVHSAGAQTEPDIPGLDNPFREGDALLPVGLTVVPRH